MAKAKIETPETDDDDISEEMEIAAEYRNFSLFKNAKLATMPTAATAVPTTPEGKKRRYIDMIEKQIGYLEYWKENKKHPTAYNKEGKEIKARTWWHPIGSNIFCKIRWGKAFLKFGGNDSVVYASADEAIDFYTQLKATVESGEFTMEFGLNF